MSNNHYVRRPNADVPLAVLLRAHDLTLQSQLERGLVGAGARLVRAEDDAHVVLIDAAADADARKLEAELAPLVRKHMPAVVLVTTEAAGRTAIAQGARGAVQKGTDPARIHAALCAVAAGLSVVDFSLVPPPLEDEKAPALTPRERQVLELVAAGCSNRRIAKRLAISEHTAKFHVNGILLKLGASTRTEAVVSAARRGLLMI